MSLDTVIQQGRFTSAGAAVTLQIRSDVDWIKVTNLTALTQAAADLGAEFYWQRGMDQGGGVVTTKLGTVANDPLTIGAIAANAGFFLVDSSIQNPGIAVAETGITNAVRPITTTNDTGALVTGSVVRLSADTNLPDLMGFDYEVDQVVAGVQFRMRWALANAPGAVGAGDGFYRQIPYDPIFYPRRRFAVNITQAAQAVVTLSVTHQFVVGQQIRFQVPFEFGMIELNNVQATIVAINLATNTITVDVDTTAFTAFAFPLPVDFPFTFAQVVPLGENTGAALAAGSDILSDATINLGYIGVRLSAGVDSPAGQANDVIYWIAGKSFSVNNL